jgi:hypothetical protein
MEVLEILNKCEINDKVVTLPEIQLDRKTYQDVAKKLELIGGKWNRKFKGFLFEQNPSELFADICNGNNRNLKKEFQFFETPESLVDELCSYILQDIENILEPSAGRGAIIQGINKKYPNTTVFYCELMELNRKQLKGDAIYLQDDFLAIEEEDIKQFDCIVANPPFSKNQDIDHFYKMYRVCKKGGRIISVMSKHWQFSSNKKETEFREFLYLHNADIINIEAGRFKDSGTMTASCLVILDK